MLKNLFGTLEHVYFKNIVNFCFFFFILEDISFYLCSYLYVIYKFQDYIHYDW